MASLSMSKYGLFPSFWKIAETWSFYWKPLAPAPLIAKLNVWGEIHKKFTYEVHATE